MINADKGSRKECLHLITGDRNDVARRLERIAEGTGAVVTQRDEWMPCGMDGDEARREARLGSASKLLPQHLRDMLSRWWLVNGGNTPNWDIACTINDKQGLLLVEAKAHTGELAIAGKKTTNGKSRGSQENHARIAKAIGEASRALNKAAPGFNLSRDRCYQLSNRFAWAWKVATLRVPVVLVYLGFLNSPDWTRSFRTSEEFQQCMQGYAKGIVPEVVWNAPLNIGGTQLWALRRTMSARPD